MISRTIFPFSTFNKRWILTLNLKAPSPGGKSRGDSHSDSTI
ncbi:MAG: hypothetical protein AAFV78_01470 [Bacteroidota bacterium]